MAHAAKRWTVEDLAALPDDGHRWELIDGVLYADGVEVTGDPRVFRPPSLAPELMHQRILGSFFVALREYLIVERVGEAILGPLDILLGASPVEPDLVVLPQVASEAVSVAAVGFPLLVVEAVSAATARADRFTKRRLYQREGIPEYWIIDVDARAIERWRPSDDRPEWLGDRIEWHPAGAAEPLVIELEPLFREITGA